MDKGQSTRTAEPKSRKRRIFLLALLIVGALYAIYRMALVQWRNAELDAIRASGYPVTLAALDRWYPEPAEGENAAELYLEAFAKYVPVAGDSQHLPVVGSGELPATTQALPPDMKDAIAGYLAAQAEALELLHRAAEVEECRFPLDPDFRESLNRHN